jgi:hypothetical protein
MSFDMGRHPVPRVSQEHGDDEPCKCQHGQYAGRARRTKPQNSGRGHRKGCFYGKHIYNINISNSNVGAVNTGNLARIDAAITMSKGTEAEEFGARLKDLTQAILADTKVSAETKPHLVEVAQAISDQAIGSKRPSKIVVTTLFGRLQELAGNVTMIAGAVEKLHVAWIYLQSTF